MTSVSARLKWALWNAEQQRLRTPWRLLFATVILAVVLFALGQVGRAIRVVTVGLVGTTAAASVGVRAVGVVLLAVVVVVTVAVAGLALDRRRVRDFGFRFDRDWWVDFAFGLGLGVALMTGVFLVELAAGWVVVTASFVPSSAFPLAFAFSVALFLGVGLYEELLVRGYLLTNLAEGLRGLGPFGPRAAAALATLLSSGLFGFAHATNPNATVTSTLAIGFAGVMLALGYLFTGELAVPIGLHISWNLAQGSVYGFPVSGSRIGASVLAVEQRGPVSFTGGAFGPEAGLLGVAAMVVGSAAIVGWVRYRYGTVRLATEVTTPELRWR